MTGEIIIEGKPFSFEKLPWVDIPNLVFNKELATECLLIVKEVLDQHNITFVLMHGTLLGAYRDKNFIPHDFDIDLAFYQKDDEAFKSIIPELYEKGIKLCRYHYGIIYSFIFKGLICDFDVICKAEFPLGFRYYRVLTELTPKKYLSTAEPLDFLGKAFMVPANPERIIAYEYGKSWRTPQKGRQGKISPIWMRPFKFMKKAFFFVLRKLHLRKERNTMEE
ncbi:MAG: LicD family protein [Prevotella sp.]|nr:LicD family protein [Prevotella sp.]